MMRSCKVLDFRGFYARRLGVLDSFIADWYWDICASLVRFQNGLNNVATQPSSPQSSDSRDHEPSTHTPSTTGCEGNPISALMSGKGGVIQLSDTLTTSKHTKKRASSKTTLRPLVLYSSFKTERSFPVEGMLVSSSIVRGCNSCMRVRT